MIKATIASCALLVFNNFGLLLTLNATGFLYYWGYGMYLLSYFFLTFVVYHYMQSDFYKHLGKEELSND